MCQIVNDDEDEDSDNDENIIGGDNSSNMDVDIQNFESDMNSVNKPANEPLSKAAAEADDGWVAVSRRSRGRKNQMKKQFIFKDTQSSSVFLCLLRL